MDAIVDFFRTLPAHVLRNPWGVALILLLFALWIVATCFILFIEDSETRRLGKAQRVQQINRAIQRFKNR